MEQEASLVAKRLRTYFLETPSTADQVVEERIVESQLSDEICELEGPGVLANCMIVVLTSLAIVLTKITLKLTKTIAHLENS